MSALLLKADIRKCVRHARLVPSDRRHRRKITVYSITPLAAGGCYGLRPQTEVIWCLYPE
jgi:hypothetical protein